MVWGLATMLGAGYAPLAPGTVGSLLAALLYLPLAGCFHGPDVWQAGMMIFAVSGLGVWSAGVVERRAGKKDPGIVVVDEWAGQWLAYLGLPFSWWAWGAGFVLFRLFDVLKPFPARRLERLAGGWGVMLDDLVAGGYALVVLQVVQRWMAP